MSDDTQHGDGRRTVGLYMPFTAAGKPIAAITFAPCTFGHLLRWQGGMIPSSLALMIELSGQTLHEIESIRHPDDARVMEAFLAHVHPTIAGDIREGVRPLASGAATFDDAAATAAAYAPRGAGLTPGAPDPFSSYDGFDPEPSERPIDHVEGLDP